MKEKRIATEEGAHKVDAFEGIAENMHISTSRVIKKINLIAAFKFRIRLCDKHSSHIFVNGTQKCAEKCEERHTT